MKSYILAKNIINSNFKRLNFPYKLTFVATYKCQSKCIYCKIWKKKPVGELSLGEINQFFKKSNKFSWVDLTGGEVFLRKDIADIAKVIITNCKNLYHLHIPTNGLAPTIIEQKIKQILSFNPNKFVVTISLDGPRVLNDRLRGISGNFDKVIETAKRLKEIKQKNFRFVIGFTLSADNKDNFEKMISEVKAEIPSLQPDDFHMNIIHTSEHYYDNISNNTLLEDLRGDVRKYRKSRTAKFKHPIGFLEDQYLRLADKYLETGKTPIICQALAGSVFVDSFGDIYPCSIYSKKVGNIKEINYDLEKLWDSTEVKSLRKSIERLNCPQCWTPCEAYQSILGKLHTIRV